MRLPNMSFFVTYILPVFYLALFSFLLQRSKFLRQNGFRPWFIVAFFIMKCIAGMINDYSSFVYQGDVVLYSNDGFALYKTLLHDPAAFVAATRQMFVVHDLSFLQSQSTIVRTVFETIKFIHFLFDIFSFGNVYTNTILFNGFTCMALFRCWIFLKNYSNSFIPGAILYLFPSAFFNSSNILKEGFCVVIISLLLPLCYKFFIQVKAKQILLVTLLFAVMFFFKFFSYYLLCLMCRVKNCRSEQLSVFEYLLIILANCDMQSHYY